MHADQLAVSSGMVRELVDAQFPGWRQLAIAKVDAVGTVNAIFRIGDRLAARFPLRPGDAASGRRRLESEAAAPRELAGATRLATPFPVVIGEPGAGYPLAWAVQTWISGVTAAVDDPGGSVAFAHDLAEFISGVRAIGTGGRTFSGQGRGGDLRSRQVDADLLRAQRAVAGRPPACPDVTSNARAAARRGRRRDEPS